MTSRSGTRFSNHFTPRSMRVTRSPATTRTSKSGRASPAGRSQPRVISRCRSDKTQSSTSILVPIFFGQPLHCLDERVIVGQFLDADPELDINAAAVVDRGGRG